MQAQQQAAVAKQAEMQQQLGAAMLASYPGYLLPPYAMVRSVTAQPVSASYMAKFPCLDSPHPLE